MKLLTIASLLLLSSVNENTPGVSEPSPAQPVAVLAELSQAILNKDFTALDSEVKNVVVHKEAKAAVAVIQPLLKHDNAEVRHYAAYALSQVDLPAAQTELPTLIEALDDREPRIRARVAFALGDIGAVARSAVPALIARLMDDNPRVRAGAVRALAKVGADAQVVLPGLAERLTDSEIPVRCLAAMALGKLGPAAKTAVPALTALQGDADADVRAAATSALEDIEPSMPMLSAALTERDANRRLWAVSVLAGMGPGAREATPKLSRMVKTDESAAVRAGAALTLGKIGPDARSAVPVLIEALQDKTARVRTGAALALGLIGSAAQDAAPALAETLKDDDTETAAEAATALGNLGPAARTAAPVLIELLHERTLVWRRRAVNVLARIGPSAQPAVLMLRVCLQDTDPQVRQDAARALVSLGPQPPAPIQGLIEALQYKHGEIDHLVRAWACISLGLKGPEAAEAVAPLIASLQDEDANVRASAIFALGKIGSPAVPSLVKALDHLDGRVRAGAAQALGIGGARRAMPALRETLHDEDSTVRLAAAGALGHIAAELQFAQDIRSLPGLEEALQSLQDAQPSQLAGREAAEWQAATAQVHTAVRALHTVERAQLMDRIFHSAWFPWLAGAGLYLGVLPAFWMVLLWLRPLWLLRIGTAVRSVPPVQLPGPLGMTVSLRGLLLIRLFEHRPRVLDAWVARCLPAFGPHFREKGTVQDRAIFVPMPIVLNGAVVASPAPSQLGQAFARGRGCLLIWGEGGAGKTSLACRIGSWAMAADKTERLCEHIMLPVLIEHAFDLRGGDGKAPFAGLTAAVRGQLQALVGQDHDVSEDLVDQLLRQRRVLVIVDHLSETGAADRDAIRPGHAEFPVHALVVTSRRDEPLDGMPKCVVQPLRIEGNRLSTFMEAYLVARGKRPLFTDQEYFEGCRRLSALVGGREVTPLLAKLYAEQMIAGKENRADSTLPTNLPDLMLGYLSELNRSVAGDQRRSDFEVQRDAGLLALECLRHHFRPEPISLETALETLGGDDARERLVYLEDQLRLIRTTEPARDHVCFTLDPLAEYLAALHLVYKSRGNAATWTEFAAKANELQTAGETIKGFLLAVRDCCVVRKVGAGVLNSLDECLGRAA